jgi:hypothetical protein
VEDAVRARERIHEQVEVGDAPLDEVHPGMIEEVLDVFPPPGGEVVDYDDVVVLCQRICKVRADEAGPAGDDVAHEEFMAAGMFRGFRIELGPSCLPEAGMVPKNRIGVSFNVASEHSLVR